MASHPNPELSENNKGFHIQFKGHCFPQMLGEGENEKAHQSTSTIAGLTVRVPTLAKQLSTAEGTSVLDQMTVIATVFLHACISRFFFFDSYMFSHVPRAQPHAWQQDPTGHPPHAVQNQSPFLYFFKGFIYLFERASWGRGKGRGRDHLKQTPC